IAILHHVDDVHVAAPMTGSSKFSEAAVPLLNQLETGDNGGVAGISAGHFKNPNDMVRRIAYVDIHPLCGFAVFRSVLKLGLLFLLRKSISCERKAEQRENYQSECGGSFHGIAPLDVPTRTKRRKLVEGGNKSL